MFIIIQLISFIIFIISSVTSQDCFEPYERFSRDHTGCKTWNPSCSFVKIGISESDKKLIVREHNKFRNMIAMGREGKKGFPSASNMLQMEWDTELENLAQLHTQQCILEHDCRNCRHLDDYAVGQNFFYRRTSNEYPKENWTLAVSDLYSEIDLTPKNVLNYFRPKKDYGHFTQIIWADTWRIGCGYSAYSINHPLYKVEELYTCNYGPAGNIKKEKIYKRGSPTRECPKNTKKSREYPGLCKAGHSGPVMDDPDPNRLLFFCDFQRDNCGIRVIPSQYVTRKFIWSGNFLEIALYNNEKVELKLPNQIGHQKGFCIRINHRRISHRHASSFQISTSVPDQGFSRKISLNNKNVRFSNADITISWKYNTDISLLFSAKSSSEMQYLDIRYIHIFSGSCKHGG